MAILVEKPTRCTFIHIPKNAGSSIRNWLKKNHTCIISKGQHSGARKSKRQLGNLGVTYCVVRNPFDWCVSWYEFMVRRTLYRIDHILKNPSLKNRFGSSSFIGNKYHLDSNRHFISTIEAFSHKDGDLAPVIRPSKAFKLFLKDESMFPTDEMISQHILAKKCDIILRFETINRDFEQIQEMLECKEPLGLYNSSSRMNYKEYYDDESIDIVKNIYKKDIKMFGYRF